MSTATIQTSMEAEDLSRLAGGYLRIISDDQVESATDGEVTFDCAAAELLKAEASELAALVVARRVAPDIVPYHFSTFGFSVAAAVLTLPPREAIEELKAILEVTKSEIRATIDDAKRSNCDD